MKCITFTEEHKGKVQMTDPTDVDTNPNDLPGPEPEPDTGLEAEPSDQSGHITDPFDPEQIKIRTVAVLIEQLISRIDHREIDLTPEFQRLRGIWNRTRQSRLIESLLLRIPIPVFYVAADDDDNWSVVDGLQRMSTVHDYISKRFALQKLEYLSSFEGFMHDRLPRPMQRRINETQLIVNVIEPGTPSDVMFNVFLRINTGGMTLNGQEIRHALISGPVRGYLRHLAESPEFLLASNNSVNPRRMADRECVLRFLAFLISPPDQYSTNDLDSYLSLTMRSINQMSKDDRLDLEHQFKQAMTAAYDIFGEDAFRKRNNVNDVRKPVSRALFEVWSVELAKLSPQELECVVGHQDELRQRFMNVMNTDRDFDRAISYSTGIPQRVHKRFEVIASIIQEFAG